MSNWATGDHRPRSAAAPAKRSMAERAAKVRFRRALSLMAMTLVLPGSAQLVAGNRRIGRWAVRITLTALAVGAVVALTSYFWHGLAFWLGTSLWVLTLARLVLIVLGVGWVALFVDAWRLGRPLSLRLEHRRWVVVVNGALAFSVAATMLFGAHLVGVHKQMVQAMFTGADAAGASDGRYNVLLIGADTGKSRWGTRTDSLTVASVDADTGRTVLIGLPRNMANFDFAEGSVMDKQFPDGFDCEGCYLNGVATWAEDHKELFKGSDSPTIDSTLSAVEGITDLDMSYWAMVDLQGFRDIVDAVGGVEVNVRDRIPVGLPSDPFYTHLEPGRQRLDGFELLWYARSRESSDDYSRMARQKCVMNAMLQQLSPSKVLASYQDVAEATSATVKTSVPPSEVGRFVDLALKAKGQKISTISLVPPLIDNTADPDMKQVHQAVSDAIDKAEGHATASDGEGDGDGAEKKSKPAKDVGMTGGALGTLDEGYVANATDDLSGAC